MLQPNTTTDARPRRRPIARVAALCALIALVGACDGDSPLSDVTLPNVTAPEGGEGTQPPEPTQPPEQTDPPAPTDPPVETQPPAEETPPTTAADDSGLSDDDITLLVLLILGLLVVAIAAIWISSRKKGDAPVATAASTQMHDLMGRGRWLHDQASMELLRTSDPAQLARAWQSTSPAIIEMEQWAASLAAGASDPAQAAGLQRLQGSVAGLRGALQSDVSLRSDPTMTNRQDLVQASAQTVQQRRAELDIALADPALRT